MRRGMVVLAVLDPVLGHEQAGKRPVVVVSSPEVSAHQRYELFTVVPLTGTVLDSPLYPRIGPTNANGLKKASYALVDQVRSIDKMRVVREYGHLGRADLAAIDEVLRDLLGL